MMSIHRLSTRNCILALLLPYSKLAMRATVTASTAKLVTSATTLCRVSSAFGTTIITATPTNGRKTARVMPQPLRKSFTIAPRSSACDHYQDGGQDGGPQEQVCAVGLDLAGLGLAQDLAGGLRAATGVVHDAIDHALVDLVVDDLAALACGVARHVDHAVDDVLVEPVRSPRDGALHAADDDIGVEDVEVVLVLEQAVAASGHGVALGDAVGALVLPVPEVHAAGAHDDGEQRHHGDPCG